jgi:succinyl-CoA synthetase alpha subunit
MPGKRFGHASVIVQGESGSIRIKTRVLRGAGVTVAKTYSEIAPLMKKLLKG